MRIENWGLRTEDWGLRSEDWGHSSFLNCTLLTDKHQPRLSLSCQSFEVLAGDGCSRSKLIANTSPSNASYNNFPKRKIFGKILSCTEFAKQNDTLIQCNTVSIFPKNTYSWIQIISILNDVNMWCQCHPPPGTLSRLSGTEHSTYYWEIFLHCTFEFIVHENFLLASFDAQLLTICYDTITSCQRAPYHLRLSFT